MLKVMSNIKRDFRLLYLLMAIISLFQFSCSNNYYKRKTFEYPQPVNTFSKKIENQIKDTFTIKDVHITNDFDGARMNACTKTTDNLYEFTIKPENAPVNDSPWYAFKMWADSTKRIFIKLKYVDGHHRYIPKISRNGTDWTKLDTALIDVADDKSYAVFPLTIDTTPTWIAAQKIISSADVYKWIESLKGKDYTSSFLSTGKSVLGRDIPYFRIGKGDIKDKRVIVLMSRQHPPEISGYQALQSFVDEILKRDELTETFLSKYDFWVFPVLNPDGIDLGHWRHNANGVDLNRDWAYFRQPETNAVTRFIVEQAKKHHNKIVLGIDFHSTKKDLWYIFNDDFKTQLHGIIKPWLASINRLVSPFKTIYIEEPLTKPYSKVWFYMQFKCEAITYEVGDETPLQLIDKKARSAAITLMDLLLRQ